MSNRKKQKRQLTPREEKMKALERTRRYDIFHAIVLVAVLVGMIALSLYCVANQ